jgi:subtilisin-like proprotein convertase family protein
MSRTASFVTALGVIASLAFAASAYAIDAPGSAPLPNFDARSGDSTEPAGAVERARKRITGRLGPESIVSSDAVNGGIRSLGASDGLLTDANDVGAQTAALDYVSGHLNVFGLDESDLSALQLAAHYTSPDGVTHLTWQQTDRGISSYDTFLSVNVAADGSIVNVTGSPVHDLSVDSAKPEISSANAAAAAAADVDGSADADGKVILADPDGDRLAWRVFATADDGTAYDEVVDGGTGAILVRRSLTADVSNASVFENHPGAAAGGTAHTVDLAADPLWLNDTAGNTRLSGRNAYAYADVGAPNGVNGGEDIPASGGTDWVYPQTAVGCGGGQPASTFSAICTWSGLLPASGSEPTNRAQATTQAFYFVNNWHDWLAQNPIAFTNPSHNFEVGGTGGSDPVLTEADDSSGTNNANMATFPDGTSPRMQMFLFRTTATLPWPAVNGDDDASIVYHEYTHGLSNRLVNNGLGGGLNRFQSKAMGEGWSDWYAMDYLVGHGFFTDAASDGQVIVGEYATNNANVGIRINALDCSVGSADATHCPGSTAAGPGGFTYGDMGHVVTYNGNTLSPAFEVHADGEIWAETLWDLRTAIGAADARGLITSAMRLSPNDPSFLDMRDAILQADAVAGGTHNAQIWQAFANRGMGFSATTTSGNSTGGNEAFDVPALASASRAQVSDPPPFGDGDAVAEPGETVRLNIPVRNPGSQALTGASGTLSSSTPGVLVSGPAASYGTIAALGSQAPATPFAITIPTSASCDNSVALSLGLSTGQGSAALPLSVPLGVPGATYTSLTTPVAIPDVSVPGVTATINVPAGPPIKDLRVSVQTNHTFIGDLHGYLTSPSGRRIVLFERIGSPANTGNGSPSNGFNVTFDDSAAAKIQDSLGSDTSPGPSGPIRPSQPLSGFDGTAQGGTWTLRMYDVVAGDIGQIQTFSLQAGPRACSTTVTPPVAATTAATAITATDATLNGSLDPAGAQTDYRFEYGTTTAYGSTTASTDAGAGSGAAPVNDAKNGLSPDSD